MGQLEEKIAVITGAGRGIGRGIAERLAREGATVAVIDISADDARETAGRIREAGGRSLAVPADVSVWEDVDRSVSRVREAFGRIEILVNNAGIGGSKRCLDTSEEEWDRMVAVNLRSVYLVCKRVIPEMLEAGKGKILNIASIYGLLGSPHTSAYSASKAGVVNFTRQLAADYSPHGIHVNSISPGLIETPMTRHKVADPENRDFFVQPILLGRVGTPEDIAGAALFLVSGDSDFITGHNLVVDGGESICLR